MEEIQAKARVCNEKKLASKTAQEASDRYVLRMSGWVGWLMNGRGLALVGGWVLGLSGWEGGRQGVSELSSLSSLL